MLPTTPLPTALPLGPAGTLRRAARWTGAGVLLSSAQPRSCRAEVEHVERDRRAQLVAERNAAALDRELVDGQLPRWRAAGVGRRCRRRPRRARPLASRRARRSARSAQRRAASRSIRARGARNASRPTDALRAIVSTRTSPSSTASAAISGDLASPSTSLLSSNRLASTASRSGALPPRQSIATSALRSPASGGTRTSSQIGAKRRQRQFGQRDLTVAAVPLPWPENDSLPWSAALPTSALAAEDDRRVERPRDRLRDEREVAQRQLGGGRGGRIAPVEPGGADRERGDARLPRRRRRARCRRRARRCGARGGAGCGRRQRQARDGARRARRRLGGEQQVDATGGVAHRDDVRRVDLDAPDANAPLERPQLVDLHLDVADLQQLRRGGIDHFDAARS